MRATIHLGKHFTRDNLSVWDELKPVETGKNKGVKRVKYIWLMNCSVGADHYFCSEIARRTKAWVTAASCPVNQANSYPKCVVEHHSETVFIHGDGSRITKIPVENVDHPEPHSSDDFFLSARKPGGVEALDEKALYFNLIKYVGQVAQPNM